jgi:hypothetical protein
VPRRTIAVAAAAVGALAVSGLTHALAPHAFVRPGRISGWALLACVAFLASYGLRKRLVVLRVGRASTWRSLHLATGAIATCLFALHAGVPQGSPFHLALWGCFVVLAGSGVVGWILSRTLPRSLANAQIEAVLERVPVLRRRLREQLQELSRRQPRSGLARLYERRLHDYFSRTRDVLSHLRRLPGEGDRLLAELAELAARAEPEERLVLQEASVLVQRKRDLDRHVAQQGALKAWLWVHVPLSGALLVGVVLHVLVISVFGGAR